MEPKILIVEHEPSIADTIAYTLETEEFRPRRGPEAGARTFLLALSGARG